MLEEIAKHLKPTPEDSLTKIAIKGVVDGALVGALVVGVIATVTGYISIFTRK